MYIQNNWNLLIGNASREKAVRYYPDNVASELIEIYNGILTAD